MTRERRARVTLAGERREQHRDGRRRPRPPARGARADGRLRAAARDRARTSPRPRWVRPGAALGDALAPLLARDRRAGAWRRVVPADEALAMVVVEASGTPLVASNADLTSTRAGGLQTDLAATFLHELAEAAGLTIHVRLSRARTRSTSSRRSSRRSASRSPTPADPSDAPKGAHGRERGHPHRPRTRPVPGRAVQPGDPRRRSRLRRRAARNRPRDGPARRAPASASRPSRSWRTWERSSKRPAAGSTSS